MKQLLSIIKAKLVSIKFLASATMPTGTSLESMITDIDIVWKIIYDFEAKHMKCRNIERTGKCKYGYHCRYNHNFQTTTKLNPNAEIFGNFEKHKQFAKQKEIEKQKQKQDQQQRKREKLHENCVKSGIESGYDVEVVTTNKMEHKHKHKYEHQTKKKRKKKKNKNKKGYETDIDNILKETKSIFKHDIDPYNHSKVVKREKNIKNEMKKENTKENTKEIAITRIDTKASKEKILEKKISKEVEMKQEKQKSITRGEITCPWDENDPGWLNCSLRIIYYENNLPNTWPKLTSVHCYPPDKHEKYEELKWIFRQDIKIVTSKGQKFLKLPIKFGDFPYMLISEPKKHASELWFEIAKLLYIKPKHELQ